MAFVSKVAPFESGHPTLTSCHTERSQSSSLVSRRPLAEDFINPSNQKNNFPKIPRGRRSSLLTFLTRLYKHFTSVNHVVSVYILVRASALALQQRRCCSDSPSCLTRLSFFLAANQGKLFRRKPCFTSQPPLLFREKQRPRHSLFRESFPRLFFASWLSAFTFMFRARPVKRHRSLLSLAPLRRPSSPQPSPRSPCPPDLLRRRRKAASPEK